MQETIQNDRQKHETKKFPKNRTLPRSFQFGVVDYVLEATTQVITIKHGISDQHLVLKWLCLLLPA